MKPDSDGLYPHGILTEESDFRAHVCPKDFSVYTFHTREVSEQVRQGKGMIRLAYQKGIEGPTARGVVLSLREIPNIVRFHIPKFISKFGMFTEEMSEEEKGRRAFWIVYDMLIYGKINFTDADLSIRRIVSTKEEQEKGYDLVLGKVKVEIKCDFNGGEKGTGNLFIQIAEKNFNRKWRIIKKKRKEIKNRRSNEKRFSSFTA